VLKARVAEQEREIQQLRKRIRELEAKSASSNSEGKQG